jgi:hypothetical protein
MRKFLYRLFFTRDDDLDLLQIMFLASILFYFISFGLVGSGNWTVDPVAWSIFKWLFGILAITGSPKWVAVLIAQYLSKTPPSSESET